MAMHAFGNAATAFGLTAAVLRLTAPMSATEARGWVRWTSTAAAVATAVEEADPSGIRTACRRAGAGAGLPAWTRALGPLCRATYVMTTMSEMPERQAAQVCADGRQAMALLTQARIVPAYPAAAPLAQRLRAAWDKEYALSCR